MPRATTIYLVRHAESRPTADVPEPEPEWPLSERGREQAQGLVPAMRALGIATLYSSPCPRAVHTVTPLAAALSKQVIIVPALHERVLSRRNLGDEYWPTIGRYWGDADFALFLFVLVLLVRSQPSAAGGSTPQRDLAAPP